MSVGVLERLKVPENNEINWTYKTVRNGKLIVHNVPHALFPNGFDPNGEKDYLPGDIMYNLAHIFRHMLNSKIYEYDYADYKKNLHLL